MHGSCSRPSRGEIRYQGDPWYANVSVIIANENNGFLSLYTNYSLTRAPSAEAIEKLRVALGEEEGPKWYLDARFWYWKPRPASAIRAMRYVVSSFQHASYSANSYLGNLRLAYRKKTIVPSDCTDPNRLIADVSFRCTVSSHDKS